MRLAKFILASVSFLFFQGTVLAKAVDKEKAETLSKALYQLLEDYPKALVAAVEKQDLSLMDSVVEKGSPWYEILEKSKKANDFALPSLAGGYPYYPFVCLSFRILNDVFKEGEEFLNVEAGEVVPNGYVFTINQAEAKDIKIGVVYKDGVMKFYAMQIPKIENIYHSQMM
jgi:hypothetical protein